MRGHAARPGQARADNSVEASVDRVVNEHSPLPGCHARPRSHSATDAAVTTPRPQHQTRDKTLAEGNPRHGWRRRVEERSVWMFRRLRPVYTDVFPAVRDGRAERGEGRQELLPLRLSVASRLHRHIHASRRQD